MIITCPHCDLARDIPAERIPPGTVRVVCPRCKEKFSLAAETSGEAPIEMQAQTVEPAEISVTAPQAANTALEATDLLNQPKAGFWLRCAGWGIDTLIVMTIQLSVGAVLGIVAGQLSEGGEIALMLLTTLLNALIAITYYVTFTGYGGQTPGKMALRMQVIRTDGSEMNYGTAAMREVLGKFVSGILLGIGYLMVAFDANKQGLHDKIANTYVIKC